MGRKITFCNGLKRAQIFFDGFTHQFSVGEYKIIGLLLDRHNLER
jgi:hypothetical protein